MFKHLSWILSFLFLTFIGDRMLGFFFERITQQSQFRYSRLYHNTENADILFVGNSRGLSFYQPEVERITQLSTFNISYNGMPADLAKVLVMDYLDRHKPPQIMVVDVTICDRYNEILKSNFKLYTPYSDRLTQLLKTSATVQYKSEINVEVDTIDAFSGLKNHYGSLFSQLYRYNSDVFQRVLFYRNRNDEDWLIDRIIGEDAIDKTKMKSYQVRMVPNMVIHLKDMVSYAQSKGVHVKLVINPYYPAFAESIKDTFLLPLKTRVEKETALPISDFSTVLTERDEIGDLQHPNKKGSIHYIHILAQNGIFHTTQNSILPKEK